MKILLINLPTRNDLKVVNIGMYYIARAIKDKGYELSILDCVSENLTVLDIIGSVSKIKPDIVALSGIITTYYFIEPLCHELKKQFHDLPILVGGSVGSSIINIHEKYTKIDFIIEGEGEKTVVEFLEEFNRSSNNYDHIAGLYVRKGGKYYYTFSRKHKGPSIGGLDYLAHPLYEKINMEFYISHITKIFGEALSYFIEYKDRDFKLFPLVPSRGCPYSCSFCYRLIHNYRTHSVDYLINQILFLQKKYGINGFPLFDELIMVNRNWLASFCDRVVEEGLDVVFFSGGGKPNLLTKDLLIKMKKANFVKLGFGVESGSQKILDLMKKKTTVEENYSAIMNTYNAGIYSQSNFVFGHFGENKDTVRETVRFIAKTNKTKENYQIFFLAVYPGTAVYDYALQKGLIKDEREHLLKVTGQGDYILNVSEFSSREELIFYVYLYLHFYDGLTLFKNGSPVLALNRWVRMLLSFAVFFLTLKKWPRGENFIKFVISKLGIYQLKKQKFVSSDIDPLKSKPKN